MIRIIGVGRYQCSAFGHELEGVEAEFDRQLGLVRLCWQDFEARAMKRGGRPHGVEERETRTRTTVRATRDAVTMWGTIGLIAACNGVCEECNKIGGGVHFLLSSGAFGTVSESFLCWEHFRLNTDILLESGILRRHTHDPLLVRLAREEKEIARLTPGTARIRTDSESDSETRSTTHTTSTGTTETRSEAHSVGWSRTETNRHD